ncbi:hypothetical protein GQ53DRAFT_827327 [Thozetella sp. PMI_491]|nr:hypothetical protein GQ53DRAFT_827327 [Thozetella sp. PMI_491]
MAHAESSSYHNSAKAHEECRTQPDTMDTTVAPTQAELDEQLKAKLEALAGGGGLAGVELENGRPVALKRSVRENMFRYI